MALAKLPTAALASALAFAACSPTFNWRNTQVPQTPLQASMPCKPEAAERPVAMPSGEVALHMMACEAGGQRFVLGWMRPPVADAAVLAAWRQASLTTLRLPLDSPAAPSPGWQWQVPGAELSQSLEAQGQGPRGEAVRLRAVYFAHRGLVYQAAIYGPHPERPDAAPFFEALRLP